MSGATFITQDEQTFFEQDLLMLQKLDNNYINKVIINESNESK